MGFQGGNVGFAPQAQQPSWINLRDRSLESVVRMWLKFNETQAVQVQQTTRVVEPADQARVKQLENEVQELTAQLIRLEMRLPGKLGAAAQQGNAQWVSVDR